MGVLGFISGKNIRRLLTELFHVGIRQMLVRELVQKTAENEEDGTPIDILSGKQDYAIRSFDAYGDILDFETAAFKSRIDKHKDRDCVPSNAS